MLSFGDPSALVPSAPTGGAMRRIVAWARRDVYFCTRLTQRRRSTARCVHGSGTRGDSAAATGILLALDQLEHIGTSDRRDELGLFKLFGQQPEVAATFLTGAILVEDRDDLLHWELDLLCGSVAALLLLLLLVTVLISALGGRAIAFRVLFGQALSQFFQLEFKGKLLVSIRRNRDVNGELRDAGQEDLILFEESIKFSFYDLLVVNRFDFGFDCFGLLIDCFGLLIFEHLCTPPSIDCELAQGFDIGALEGLNHGYP